MDERLHIIGYTRQEKVCPNDHYYLQVLSVVITPNNKLLLLDQSEVVMNYEAIHIVIYRVN